MTPTQIRTGSSGKYPGMEPLPGYRLLKLLGRGGFGEVWKCEAPGGLCKAVKFVVQGGEQFRQELAAFEHVRSIRHPYLLTLERVDLIGGDLVTIMELADCQIRDRLSESQQQGLRGIPRAELLGYLREAAEALDMLSDRYGLQHLDVKPENLFLLSGHMKVGDYGLVRRKKVERGAADGGHGFTPRYSAPEILNGNVDPRSDQYSLALVYAELLTGHFPFSGQTSQQLMDQHLYGVPDLSALPPADRPCVGRALAKNPAHRYPSCRAFVQDLAEHVEEPAAWPPDLAGGAAAGPEANGVPAAGEDCDATVPNKPRPGMRVGPGDASPLVDQMEAFTPKPPRRKAYATENGPPDQTPVPSVSTRLAAVVPVDYLHGLPLHLTRRAERGPGEYVAAVIDAALAASSPGAAGDAHPESAVACQFLSTIPPALLPYKLLVVGEAWDMAVDARDPMHLVLRWDAPAPRPARPEPRGAPPAPKSGIEIVISRPVQAGTEYAAVGTAFGPQRPDVTRKLLDDGPAILDQIRRQLQNVEERRSCQRVAAAFPLRVYPLYSDGVVGSPIAGACRDVSEGGVRFVTPLPVRTEQMYLEFHEVAAVAGLAILIRTVRTSADPGGAGEVTAGRFHAHG